MVAAITLVVGVAIGGIFAYGIYRYLLSVRGSLLTVAAAAGLIVFLGVLVASMWLASTLRKGAGAAGHGRDPT